MALNVGENFKQRWLDTPLAVRECYERELRHICELLEPTSYYDYWLKNHKQLEQQNQLDCQKAYAERKQQILDEQAYQAELRRQQRQAELEQALALQRQAQQQAVLQLQQDEQQQQQLQLQALQAYAVQLQQEQVEVAQVNLSQAPNLANATSINQLKLDKKYSDRLAQRLTQACAQWIEQSTLQLKGHLQQIASDEIAKISAEITATTESSLTANNESHRNQNKTVKVTVKKRY